MKWIIAVLTVFFVAGICTVRYYEHQEDVKVQEIAKQEQWNQAFREVTACFDKYSLAFCSRWYDSLTAAHDRQTIRACELYRSLVLHSSDGLGRSSYAILEETCKPNTSR